MQILRNFTIKSRLVLAFLLVILIPILSFGYINYSKIDITFGIILSVCAVSFVIAIVIALLVGSSIVKPIEIIQSSLQSFSVKKSIPLIKDSSIDEIADLSSDLNKIYEEWNSEVVKQGKRQLKLDKENEQTNIRANSVETQLKQTRSLLSIAQELNLTFDFQTNCKTILDEAIRSLNIQWASILLIDREKNEMKVACVRGVERSLLDDLAQDNYPSIRLKPHEGLAGLVIKDGLPLIANKGHNDSRFKQFKEFNNRDEKIASLLCVPIKSKNGNVLGIINFVNRQIPPVFRNEDIPYANDLAILASLAIERSRLYNNIFTDKLTNLIAHNVWLSYLEQEGSRSQRYCQICSVVVFDIDDFGSIVESSNDEFATSIIGDCGNIISKMLRDCDKASSNQERFYCLLPNTDSAGAVFFAGRIKEAIEGKKYSFNNNKYNITLSAGIATYPDNVKDTNLILKFAVKAVTDAHKAGGNRAVIYQES